MVTWKQTFTGRLGFACRLVWRTALLQLALGVPLLLIITLLSFLAAPMATTLLANPQVMALLGSAGMLIGMVFYLLMYMALFAGMAMAVQGAGQVAIGEALRIGWRRLPVMANAMLLIMLIGMVVMLLGWLLAMLHPLLVLSVFIIFLWVMPRLFTVVMVAVMEDVSPWQVVKRGWQLSSGFWITITSNIVLLTLLMFAMLSLVVGFMYMLGAGSLGLWMMQAQSGMQQLLMTGSLPQSMGYGVVVFFGLFMAGIMLLQLLMMMVMMAFSVVFYREQLAQQGDDNWQLAAAASGIQWWIMLAWMLALAAGSAAMPKMTTVNKMQAHPHTTKGIQHTMNRHASGAQSKHARQPSLTEQKAALFARWQDRAYADAAVNRLYRSHPNDLWLMQAQAWSWYRSGNKTQAKALMSRACKAGAAPACLLAGEVRR